MKSISIAKTVQWSVPAPAVIVDDPSIWRLRGGGSVEHNSSANATAAEASTSKKKKKKTKSSSSSSTRKKTRPWSASEETKKSSSVAKTKASSAKPTEKDKQGPSSDDDGNDDGSQPQQQSALFHEILQQEDYYEILGLSRTSFVRKDQQPQHEREIKKAYRKRALLTHPDKTGGDRRAFDKVSEAYDVLSDETKRRIYNTRGKAGLDNMQNGGMAAEDFFQRFFNQQQGDPFHRQQQQQEPRNRTVRYQLEVTLEELYRGTTRNVLVSPPNQSPFLRRPQNQKPKQVSVSVPAGTVPGESIVLSGAMDFEASATPADLVFVVQVRRHAVYQHQNYDLAITVPLRLAQIVPRRPIPIPIPHISGESLAIQANFQHMLQVLRGYGMPKNAARSEFGDLYVQFQLEMPDWSHKDERLTDEEQSELQRLLNKMEGLSESLASDDDNTAQVLPLQPARREEFGRASGIPPHPEPPNDDEPGHSGFSQQFFFHQSGGTNPFFGTRRGPMYPEEDEGTECRQM